jgi:serine/threonine protein kinase
MIDPLPGDIFHAGQILNNTYEIEGVLGRGGTGEVYRARNQITGRVVAIKALNKQFSGNEAYTDLMKREEQMRDVLDDAVVRYTECSRTDQGHVFLVMDFIDGPSMSDVMIRRRMEPRELMIVAHRVAEGLVAAHKKGIVHRDLSPDNVILRGGMPEKATIIDFGIAKDTAAGARTIVGNDFAGKYEYAAPEQLEGRAETRSDLYALGATLLAAFRGQVPFAGATPGEMVRRKQMPLDTEGVPEPLKGLIDWLTAPKLADRPVGAESVVQRLDAAIRPQSQRGGRQTQVRPPAARESRPRNRWPVWAMLVLLIAGGGGAGAYYSGQLDRFFTKPLPVATPYRLTAGAAKLGAAQLTGNAPDEASAALIRQAYSDAAGVAAPPTALTMAAGVPSETWPSAVAVALDLMRGTEDWTLEIADRAATAGGIAADRAARDATAGKLQAWALENGFSLALNLSVGPIELPQTAVRDALAAVADCGPLSLGETPPEIYSPQETVRVFGYGAGPEARGKVEAALAAVIGDRRSEVTLTELNPPVCAVRAELPDRSANDISLWFGQGATGETNLSGVFHEGDNPVIEVLAPEGLKGLRLTVFSVEENGDVTSLMPNVFQEENLIDPLGKIENGLRRITIAHSMFEEGVTERRLAFRVAGPTFGKSGIIAVLSRQPLFDLRRPTAESVEGLVKALQDAGADDSDVIVGVATRLLETRP